MTKQDSIEIYMEHLQLAEQFAREFAKKECGDGVWQRMLVGKVDYHTEKALQIQKDFINFVTA